MMSWTRLVSSNLDACAYDPESKVLMIRFKSGATHSYGDVDADTAEGLVNAPSPGSYFHANIKNVFAEV